MVAPVNELVRFALVAFFPRVDDVPGLEELGVDDKIAALRRESSWLFWIGVVGAAFFFQIAPILTVYRPWPAVFLTPDELDRHAYALATHPVYLIRQTAVLLKLVAGLFWGMSPEIRAMVGLSPYRPDPGTRRMEAMVARPAEVPRAPAASLVQLGRREEERGRGQSEHAFAEGRVA
jgi:hypothetical protein